MPAETEPHARTWMAWPSSGYTLGDTQAEADEARQAWAAVAQAVARFEPVAMLVAPEAAAVARDYLGADADLHLAPLDDAWMRDTGPSFVIDPDGRLGAVDWVFNGWGAQSWARWEHDAQVGATVAAAAGAEVVSSKLVNEGGASTSTGTAACCSPRPSSSIPTAIPAGPAPTWRPSSPAPSAPSRPSGCLAG
jgi:agmatine deiminase